MGAKKTTSIAILVAVVIAVQLLTQVTGTSYYLTQLTMTIYSCLLIVGLCLVMGYAGQISLGHAAFFALGAYVPAILTTRFEVPCLAAAALAVLDVME